MNNENLTMSVECGIIENTENKNVLVLSNDIIERKICAKCKQKLPLDMFNIRSRKTLMRHSYCKICRPIASHEWRTKNLEIVREKEKLYKTRNKYRIRQYHKEYMKTYVFPLESKFLMWKSNASKRNILFDLTFEQVKSMPLICHYTGRALTLKRNQRNTISLDRIDPSKGYTPTNVVFCCSFVNIMKHTSSYEDFLYTCKEIAEHHNN